MVNLDKRAGSEPGPPSIPLRTHFPLQAHTIHLNQTIDSRPLGLSQHRILVGVI